MRLILPERHLKPSQRLLVGLAVLAALSASLAWTGAGRWGLVIVAGAWGAPLGWAAGYVGHSWVRIHPERGLSWCLRTVPWRPPVVGSIELHAADIAELRLESSLLARLLGLWDLQIVQRDGTLTPRFRFFQGIEKVAEELHGYLQQR